MAAGISTEGLRYRLAAEVRWVAAGFAVRKLHFKRRKPIVAQRLRDFVERRALRDRLHSECLMLHAHGQ